MIAETGKRPSLRTAPRSLMMAGQKGKTMDLVQLTNHQAGIVVYPDNSIIVTDWCYCGEDCLPAVAELGLLLQFPQEAGYFEGAESEEQLNDVRHILPGSMWLTDEVTDSGEHIADTDLDILYDPDSDIARLFLTPDLTPDDVSGRVYTMRDGVRIVVLDSWI